MPRRRYQPYTTSSGDRNVRFFDPGFDFGEIALCGFQRSSGFGVFLHFIQFLGDVAPTDFEHTNFLIERLEVLLETRLLDS